MPAASLVRLFKVENAVVQIYSSKEELGKAAAARAVSALRAALSEKAQVRLIVATGNSQDGIIGNLVQATDVDWPRVEAFHMDEYIGLPAGHPASFRRWLKTRFMDLVRPGRVYYLNGDAPDLAEECRRYEGLLRSAPIDLCLLGIGENGHIAFNDPHVADFHDPAGVKRVELDERCRMQQVGEGHFSRLEEVPREALTLTCPTLMSAQNLVCCVPERRKAEAARNALEGPISTLCPGSILRTHPRACILLDADSASLLKTSE